MLIAIQNTNGTHFKKKPLQHSYIYTIANVHPVCPTPSVYVHTLKTDVVF